MNRELMDLCVPEGMYVLGLVDLVERPSSTMDLLVDMALSVENHHGATCQLYELAGFDLQEATVLATLITGYYPGWAEVYFAGWEVSEADLNCEEPEQIAFLAVCILAS